MARIIKKICMIGPEGVGKTSLVRRYVDNSFSEDYLTTIGVQISQKKVKILGEKSVEFILWDIEGFTNQQEYPIDYLYGASGFIFVADVSNESTLSHLIAIKSRLERMPDFDRAAKIFVLNKADLISESASDMALDKLRSALCEVEAENFFKGSAKNGRNVESFFHRMATEVSK